MREIISKFLVDGAAHKPAAAAPEKPAPAAPQAPRPQPAAAPQKSPEASIAEAKPREPVIEQKPAAPPAEKIQSAKEEVKMGSPQTAAEIIRSLCDRFRPEKAGDYASVFHFDLSGEGGGQFTVTIENGKCSVEPGLQGQPKCLVQAAAATYSDIEFGRTNAEMAFMTGKIKISNVGEMLRFVKLFNRLQG